MWRSRSSGSGELLREVEGLGHSDDWRGKPSLLAGCRSPTSRYRSDSWTCWLQNGVEALELDTRILGGKAPVDLNPLRVALSFPGGYLLLERLFLSNAPIQAWQQERNQAQVTISWRFAMADARIKLKRLYPSIEV